MVGIERKELGQTEDPRELIPGDVPAIFENARALGERAEDALAAGRSLQRIDAGFWTGKAHDAWSKDKEIESQKWIDTGDAELSGGQIMQNVAYGLMWAQQQAAQAIALWKQGEQATADAKAQHEKADREWEARQHSLDPPTTMRPMFQDTGEAFREAARELLQRGRKQYDDICEQAATQLEELEEGAPTATESTASQAIHGVMDVAGLLPAGGDLVDLANAGYYAVQGRGSEAATSAAAAIPFVGWGAGGRKVFKLGEKILADDAKVAARFGNAVRKDYRATFYEANPDIPRGSVVVHHAVEQNAARLYPKAGITWQEMHSAENLRGIAKADNVDLHLRTLRKEWNRFYVDNPAASKQDLLDHATKLDQKYGDRFNPPR